MVFHGLSVKQEEMRIVYGLIPRGFPDELESLYLLYTRDCGLDVLREIGGYSGLDKIVFK